MRLTHYLKLFQLQGNIDISQFIYIIVAAIIHISPTIKSITVQDPALRLIINFNSFFCSLLGCIYLIILKLSNYAFN